MTKQIENNEIKLLSIRNRFLDINYKALEEANSSHSVHINDKCESIKVKNNEISIIYYREVSIDDNTLFNIKIRVESILLIERDNQYSDDDYKKHFENNYLFYYRNTSVASTISLIVGQMTGAFGRNPLLVAFKDR